MENMRWCLVSTRYEIKVHCQIMMAIVAHAHAVRVILLTAALDNVYDLHIIWCMKVVSITSSPERLKTHHKARVKKGSTVFFGSCQLVALEANECALKTIERMPRL